MKGQKKPRKIVSPHKALKKENDVLWAKCVKARTGNVSEYSGKEGPLHAHHIVGKLTYRTRWELENGIALTPGEHKFIAHNESRRGNFEAFVKRLRGDDIYERMRFLNNTVCKTNLSAVNMFLKIELLNIKNMDELGKALFD